MSIFLSKLGLGFKTVLLFLKNYGTIILVVIMGIASFLFLRQKQNAVNALTKQIQDLVVKHNQEVDELQRSHEQEIQRLNQVETQYQHTIQTIEQQYQSSSLQLTTQQKQELHNIIQQNQNDPQKMSENIHALWGINVFIAPSGSQNS